MRGTDDAKTTVLLVEDFEDIRFMMRRLLEMSGYRVLEAANGREAVELAKEQCPDLILMDLSLPGLDGLSATRLIRELESMCDVPIIAVSAHDRAEYHARALAAGCNEYVSKPVDFDTLEAALGRLCPPGYGPTSARTAGARAVRYDSSYPDTQKPQPPKGIVGVNTGGYD